jgi:hypothetical protein
MSVIMKPFLYNYIKESGERVSYEKKKEERKKQ